MIAFNHPACALKRAAVLSVGGYRQAFWPAEDCDLWARVVEAGYRVAVQDEYLLKYRIHGSSASISRARLMQQKTIWLERCIAARRAKEPEPTWEQFQSERRKVAWPTRLNQSRQELGVPRLVTIQQLRLLCFGLGPHQGDRQISYFR